MLAITLTGWARRSVPRFLWVAERASAAMPAMQALQASSCLYDPRPPGMRTREDHCSLSSCYCRWASRRWPQGPTGPLVAPVEVTGQTPCGQKLAGTMPIQLPERAPRQPDIADRLRGTSMPAHPSGPRRPKVQPHLPSANNAPAVPAPATRSQISGSLQVAATPRGRLPGQVRQIGGSAPAAARGQGTSDGLISKRDLGAIASTPDGPRAFSPAEDM